MKKTIEKVIKQLEVELAKLSRLPDYSHVKIRPNKPATAAEIKAYEDYLERPLPKSYRAFLELYNGYPGIAYPGEMLSIQDVMPKGKWFDKIQKWKKQTAKYGSGNVLDGIVFANMGQPNNYAYFDPNQPSKKDELTVVEEEPGDDPEEYETLVEFLEECLETCKYGISEAMGLEPDPDADEDD